MGRSYLQATGTEFHIHIIIQNDRNFPVYQRHNNSLTVQMCISLVVWIDTHRSVAQNSFRSGSGDSYKIRRINNLIANVIQLRIYFFVNHLFVAEGCFCGWVPIDHAGSAINLSFVVKIYKGVDYAIGILFIHGERGAIPVATRT